MAWKETFTITKPSHDVPNFDEWIDSLPSDYLSSYYQVDPSCENKSPREVVSGWNDNEATVNGVNLIQDLLNVQTEIDPSGLITTTQNTWATKRSADLNGIIFNHVWLTEQQKNEAVAQYDNISSDFPNIPCVLFPREPSNITYTPTAFAHLNNVWRDTYNISMDFSGQEI